MRITGLLVVAVPSLLGACTLAPTPVSAPPSEDTRIAFTSDRDGNGEVYVMNADGSNQVRLTNNPGYDEHPT